MKIRKAAVAGTFYDADARQLRQRIASLLGAGTASAPHRLQALIVPHAGYIYSGKTAAEAYRLIAPLARQIQRVVLFGPAHRVALSGMALPSVEAFSTPLGTVPLDTKTIQRISALPEVCLSDAAHQQEHSLEVQLPFLQTVLGDFSLVPVVVGHCAAPAVASVMDQLWGGEETLLIVSTDLSHFHPYDKANQVDTLTCRRIVEKDKALSGQDACGANALNGLMSTERCQSLAVELVDRCNSGDTAGDKERVVGYGSFILH